MNAGRDAAVAALGRLSPDDARAIARALPGTLDAAWAAVEAVLPEGWAWGHLQLQVDEDGTNPEWDALAGNEATGETLDVLAATPAAALLALAERLAAR